MKRSPFEGQTPEEVVRKVQAEEPVSLRRLRPSVPRELETVCLKCLEKDPKKRYATAGELADELRRFLNGEPIRARPPGRLAQLVRAARKRPLRSAAAALLALALAVGLGAGYYLDPQRPRREVAAALRQGHSYEFRGDEPLPGPFREVVGDTGALKRNPGEDCFRIETLGVSLWELVADPGCERYRLTAEVRHDRGSATSFVGFFLCYREHRTAAGERQSGFYTLVFADRGLEAELHKDGNGGPVSRFQVRSYLSHVRSGEVVFPCASVTHGLDFRPELPIGRPGPWRRLGVEVTPEGIKTFWADAGGDLRLAEEVPAAQLARRHGVTTGMSPEAAGVPTDYRARAGVGLYVLSGAASFRHVAIQPLRNEGESTR